MKRMRSRRVWRQIDTSHIRDRVFVQSSWIESTVGSIACTCILVNMLACCSSKICEIWTDDADGESCGRDLMAVLEVGYRERGATANGEEDMTR